MGTEVSDDEVRTRERFTYLRKVIGTRLAEMRRNDPGFRRLSYPLPFYINEGSEELRLLLEHFRPDWKEVRAVRGETFELVFFR